MKFFVILEIVFITARIAVTFFPEVIPTEAETALIWGCAVCGIIAGVFIGVELYNKIKGRKDKD
ncbi:MAG: hypothetical protein K2L42_07130 [Clostridia bacterium]|nr:hypothetical protein [Clostridia bacterium]